MHDSIKILTTQMKIFNTLLKKNNLVKVDNDTNENIIKIKSYPIKVSNNRTNKIINNLFFSI